MNITQQRSPAPAADALEVRDAWRAGWRILTSDVLLAVVLAWVAAGVLAWSAFPQMPSEGTSDALAFSAWQAEARALTGSEFGSLQAVGAFSLMQAPWLRALVSLALALVLTRGIDRAVGLLWPAGFAGRLRDETRMRVIATNDPADVVLDRVATAARRLHLRVARDPRGTWLAMRTPPGSDAWSVLAHAALALSLACLLLNMALSWDDPRTQVVPDATARAGNALALELIAADDSGRVVYLSADGITARLPVDVPREVAPGLTLAARETFPVMRVSAATRDGRPLTMTLSSYSEPSTDALLTFRPADAERSVAIDSARMFVIFSPARGGRMSAFTLPAGRLITETAIAPTMVVSDVTIAAQPEYGAVIAANFHPGALPAAVLAVVALLAALSAALHPAKRVLVRAPAEGWVEFYASGADVRRIVNVLSEA